MAALLKIISILLFVTFASATAAGGAAFVIGGGIAALLYFLTPSARSLMRQLLFIPGILSLLTLSEYPTGALTALISFSIVLFTFAHRRHHQKHSALHLTSISRADSREPLDNTLWKFAPSWMKTTESTIRFDRADANRVDTEPLGHVYVLRCPAHPENMFKIGFTIKPVEQRVAELSGTSTPEKFLLVEKFSVRNARAAEGRVHVALATFRVNQAREFFIAPYDQIRPLIVTALAEPERANVPS